MERNKHTEVGATNTRSFARVGLVISPHRIVVPPVQMVAISLAFRCKQKRKEREGEKTISKEKRI
jgi:hypothetical protein